MVICPWSRADWERSPNPAATIHSVVNEPTSPNKKETHCALCTFHFEYTIAQQARSGQPRILTGDSNHTRLTDTNIASTEDRTGMTLNLATEPQELYVRIAEATLPERRCQAHVKM